MKTKYLFLFLLLCMLTACDTVSEDERLEYVAPATVNRAILIEDFTGQRCVNCPTATDEIHALQAVYGDSNIIAVGIHSGPFARKTTLRTDTGDEYYEHWGVEEQPTVIVNRTSGLVSNTARIGNYVKAALEKDTPLTLHAKAQYDAESRKATISVEALSAEAINGKLQVWLTEDNIVDVQLMPDGSTNTAYVHNHVFRSSVTNDIYGDPISISDDAPTTTSVTATVEEAWKAADLSAVVFITGASGEVLQVVKVPIVTEE